jgi:hypothetical protein
MSALTRAALVAIVLAGPARAAEAPPADAAWQGTCGAESCVYQRAAVGGAASLVLARRPGSTGLAIGFLFAGAVPDRTRSAALSIDGQPFATLKPGADIRAIDSAADLWLVGAAPLTRLAEQLHLGGMLRLSYLDVLGGPHDVDVDLGGSGEIVARLDVGDVTKPHTVAPTPQPGLALPDRISEIRRLGVPPRLAELHAQMTTCEALDSPRLSGTPPLIVELSPTAVLYALPCAAGHNQLLAKLWVLEFGEIGGIAPQSFALYQPRLGWFGADLLPNVTWDPSGQQLAANAAPSDGCAWSGRWRWRGTTFGLADLTLSNCDGRRGPTRVYPPK